MSSHAPVQRGQTAARIESGMPLRMRRFTFSLRFRIVRSQLATIFTHLPSRSWSSAS